MGLDLPLSFSGRDVAVDSVFPYYTKLTMLALLKSKNKLDMVVSDINFNSMHCDKFHFILDLIQLLSISMLFSLQKFQFAVYVHYGKTRIDTLSVLMELRAHLHGNLKTVTRILYWFTAIIHFILFTTNESRRTNLLLWSKCV